MRAVGAPFTLGIGAHPLIARLRQHVVPTQPPKLFSIGFRVHPPNPPQGGLSCSLLPLAVQDISDQILQQSTTEMDWCRVVGPGGLCRPLDEKQVSNKQPGPSRPVRATRRASRAGQGRAGRAGQGRAGQGRAGQVIKPYRALHNNPCSTSSQTEAAAILKPHVSPTLTCQNLLFCRFRLKILLWSL